MARLSYSEKMRRLRAVEYELAHPKVRKERRMWPAHDIRIRSISIELLCEYVGLPISPPSSLDPRRLRGTIF